jgi:ribosomal protein L16 Arg81 hydroxylase
MDSVDLQDTVVTDTSFQVHAVAGSHLDVPWSFEALVAPISTQRFCAKYWGKRPLHLVRGQPDFYRGLISLAELEPYLTVGGFFDRDSASTPYRSDDGGDPPPTNVSEIYERMARGKPLRLRKLENLMHPAAPAITMVRGMEHALGHRLDSLSCYIAPAKGLGLGPHHDETEIFTLQISGSKRWRLYHNVVADVPGLYDPSDLGEPTHDITLEAGDLLYLPGGLVHDVAAGPPSFSLTIVFEPFRWNALLELLVVRLARQETFLKAMPAGDLRDSGWASTLQREFAACVALIGEELAGLTASDLIEAVVSQHIGHTALPPDAHLDAVLHVNDITQDTRLERRPRVPSHLVRKQDRLVLLLPGGHTLQLDLATEPAMRTMLGSERSFRVSEIHAGLSAATKLALAKRLVVCGLLRPTSAIWAR